MLDADRSSNNRMLLAKTEEMYSSIAASVIFLRHHTKSSQLAKFPHYVMYIHMTACSDRFTRIYRIRQDISPREPDASSTCRITHLNLGMRPMMVTDRVA